jgi:hypothetical protein
MPNETEIQTERQRLYESAALREDINDPEATVLLEWGEKHVIRLGQAASDSADLEQKARFLRQLLKNINRFVGQRQFNDRAGQIGYMEKVTKWLENPSLGFKNYSADELLDKLPSDTKDMAATLNALLSAIDPGNPGPQGTPDTSPQSQDRLGGLRDAVSAQSVQGEGTPPHHPSNLQDAVEAAQKGNPGPQGTPDTSPQSQDRVGGLRDAVLAQSAQGEGTPPHHPSNLQDAVEAAQKSEAQAGPAAPAPEDVRQSVIDQLSENRHKKPEDPSPRTQDDSQSDAPSLLDTLRQAITGHLPEKHPNPKDNEGLESLRQSVEKKQDELAPSGDSHGSNIGPHGQPPADHHPSIRDQLINRPHQREEDEEHGKNTK